MWQRIQTYLFVTLITILIWLYAEGENLKQHVISPTIQFVAPPGEHLLIDPSRPQRRVQATIRCTTSQREELRRLLEAGPIELVLREDPESEDPYQEINLRDLLSEYAAIGRSGVNILEVKPATIRVRVEYFETRTLPVEVVTDGHFEFHDPPEVEPAEAELIVPGSRAQNIDDAARIIAPLSAELLAGIELDRQQVIENVPLVAPPALHGDHVQINPATVSVRLTLRQKTATAIIKTIPVLLRIPWPVQDEYLIKPNSPDNFFLRNVVLRGPSDVIADLEQNPARVSAELALTIDDLEQAAGRDPKLIPVQVRVPPQVTVIEQPQPVAVTVTRRLDAAANGLEAADDGP